MKYCFLTVGSWERNASLVRVRELGAQLAERGVEVAYLLDDMPFNRQSVPPQLHPKAEIYYLPRGWSPGTLRARRRAVAGWSPDYVHVLNPSIKPFLALVGMRWQKVVGDWDEWRARKRGRKHGPGRRLVEQYLDGWLRRRACLVLVASRWLQEQFRAHGCQSVYIPYATYLEDQADGESPFLESTFVYMGSMQKRYDVDLVFHAALELRNKELMPPVVVIGEGEEYDKWRRFVAEHKLDNVTFTGFLLGEALWRRLRHAHALLFPIRPTIMNLARCPSKVFAYAQARRPIITCAVGEVDRMLGDAATYVDCTSGAFAAAIERLMREPVLPDVDYHVERQTWSARAETLLDAIAALQRE